MATRLPLAPARCHPDRVDAGRGLCRRDYLRAARNGTLIDYPRKRPTFAEWFDDYRMLTGEGYSNRHIADRLGVSIRAVQKRVQTARRLGWLR